MRYTDKELDNMTDGKFFGFSHGYTGHDCRTWNEIVRIHGDEANDYLEGFNEGVADREADKASQ